MELVFDHVVFSCSSKRLYCINYSSLYQYRSHIPHQSTKKNYIYESYIVQTVSFFPLISFLGSLFLHSMPLFIFCHIIINPIPSMIKKFTFQNPHQKRFVLLCSLETNIKFHYML
ncbi:hypothetical protein Pst134EB_014028 [Puccinia striiformis f. sp. tritici]|nr:hypothetical protein Pst134EB_014028 [Puccinia striiformis f. sp. tritici]